MIRKIRTFASWPQQDLPDVWCGRSAFGRIHLFVVRDGRLIGVVSQRDLMELLSVKLELIDNDISASAAPPLGHGCVGLSCAKLIAAGAAPDERGNGRRQ